MFLNDKLEDVLDGDWVEIAKEKTAQRGRRKYGDEDIKPEFKKIFALNHFAFGDADAVEFAHKTVGEYFTAVKLYGDYFECILDATIEEAWRHIFNAFRYKEIPVDIIDYLVGLIESKQKNCWKSKFFQIYYDGIEQQLLVIVASKKSEYLTIHTALLNEIQLVFRNLTWLLTGLGFNNREFNNTERNLEILASYMKGDVNLSGWKNLDGINLSLKDLKEANFSEGDLKGANFKYSILNKAILNGAHLHFSDFSCAYIEGAKFGEAHLEDANFDDAYLFGGVLKKAHLERSTFLRADLRNASIKKAYFNDAKLEKAHLENAQLEEAHFEGAQLQGAYLKEANLKKSFFTKARLEGAHLEGAHLEASHFEEACLNNTYLEGIYLDMVHLERANFENACFGRERSNQLDFEEITPGMIKIEGKYFPLVLLYVYLLESDLPKYDEYIQKKYITMIDPIVQTDDYRKTYNPETNRMEITDRNFWEYI